MTDIVSYTFFVSLDCIVRTKLDIALHVASSFNHRHNVVAL